MPDAMSIGIVVNHAVRGDETAWKDIVWSYTPLVRAVCRRYGLSRTDTEDVGGRVWMSLLVNIARIREPVALPSWLRTTTRRECQSVLRSRDHDASLVDEDFVDPAEPPSDARLLAEEQRAALRAAIADLAPSDRRLLSLLFSDPPTPYAEIGRILDMPVGAIGPTRQRILKRLREAHVWHAYQPSL